MNGLLTRKGLMASLGYIAIGLVILFFRLMPLNPGEPSLPGPELTLCLTFAWVLRRPDQLPAIAIVALTLTGDLILGRPFGLWSFLALVGSEMLRLRSQRWADQAFLFEWLRISVLMGLMIIGERMIMILFLLPVPPLGPVLLKLLATIAAYPLVVLAVRLIGVRRLTAAELEMVGH